MSAMLWLPFVLSSALSAAVVAPPAPSDGDATDTAPPTHVVGGDDVPLGTWSATSAVFIGGYAQCTGTLVAPNLVLTAKHCRDSQLSAVLIGANKLSRPEDGEVINVIEQISAPAGLDAALLVLEHDATTAPHPIALGWAAVDIAADAQVTIVGFGAVNNGGSSYVDTLQAVTTIITNPTCNKPSEGCEAVGAELIAGETGKDSCFGDSGGPLYLVTNYGTFLAGVTSRGILSGSQPCGYGGIYVRADALGAWIEETAQRRLARPAAPVIEDFEAELGDATEIPIDANDPSSGDHTYEIVTPPAHGTIALRGTSRPTYTPTAGYLGADTFELRVVDANNDARAATATGAVTVVEAQNGCGCQSATDDAAPTAWLFYGSAVFAMLQLRRRRAYERFLAIL